MLKQRKGVVINIGTPQVSYIPGSPPTAALLASKGPIHSLTIQLAAEFGKYNIRFNTIAPCTGRMPMYEDTVDWSAELHLLDRAGEMEDIAHMVYTVAKSSFVNGAVITT
jgi:NAD(P)-dependent dehydrogenase (short-subunit alcohol dehydrogenase family)